MKKKAILIFLAITFGFSLFLAYKTVIKYYQNRKIIQNRQHLPSFSFYDLTRRPFAANKLKRGVPVCIIYYNSECEHCQKEAIEIRKNIDALKGTQIIMVSTNAPETTKLFIKDHRLEKTDFIWLFDKDFCFAQWFGNSLVPSVFIYDSHQTLIKEYVGEVKIEAILENLNHAKKG